MNRKCYGEYEFWVCASVHQCRVMVILQSHTHTHTGASCARTVINDLNLWPRPVECVAHHTHTHTSLFNVVQCWKASRAHGVESFVVVARRHQKQSVHHTSASPFTISPIQGQTGAYTQQIYRICANAMEDTKAQTNRAQRSAGGGCSLCGCCWLTECVAYVELYLITVSRVSVMLYSKSSECV